MSTAEEEPLGVGWEAFFMIHALPRAEEEAFRGYLTANHVPDDTGLQDLEAHYAEFQRQWNPGPLPRDREVPHAEPE